MVIPIISEVETPAYGRPDLVAQAGRNYISSHGGVYLELTSTLLPADNFHINSDSQIAAGIVEYNLIKNLW